MCSSGIYMCDQTYIEAIKEGLARYYIKNTQYTNWINTILILCLLVCVLMCLMVGNKDERTVERSRTTHDLIVYCEECIIIVEVCTLQREEVLFT